MNHPREWTASELFSSLVGASIISPEEKFEDWMHDRPAMIELMVDDMIENGVDPDEEDEE